MNTPIQLKGWTQFAACRHRAISKLDWIGPMLCAGLVPEDSKEPTASCTADGRLFVNLSWLETLSIDEGACVLAHEAFHLLLNTHSRTQRLVSNNDPELLRLSNIASDLAINSLLVSAGFHLGATNGVLPAHFNLRANATHEWYFAQLVQQRQQQRLPPPAVMMGACGTCAGGATETTETLEAGSNTVKLAHIATLDRLAQGQRPGQRSEEIEILCQDLPAVGKVPWEALLRRAVRRGVNWATGATDARFNGWSKRQAAVQQLGIVLPRYVGYTPKIEFVEDVSGSMNGLHDRIVAEITAVMRTVRCKIRYVSIDDEIHEDADITRASDITTRGGGGTMFTAYFRRLETGRVRRPDIVIFATDGWVNDVPATPPPGVRFIWVIVGSEKRFDWGEHVYINEE